MKTTTIVLGKTPPLDPILRAGETAVYRGQPSAAFRPSRLKIFGGGEARIRPISLEWAGAHVDLSRSEKPFEPDLAHARGVRLYTESSAELTVRNDGGDAEIFPVFFGRGGLGEHDEYCSSEMFFGLEKVRAEAGPAEIKPGGQERFAARFHFPTRIVRARVRSPLPLGQLRVTALNIAGMNLVLSGDLPIEALEDTAMAAIAVDATTEVNIWLRRVGAVNAADGAPPASVSIELDILARGEFDESAYREARAKSRREYEAYMKSADAAALEVDAPTAETDQSDAALLESLAGHVSPGMILFSVEQGMLPPDLAHALLRRFQCAWEKKSPAASKET